MAIKIKPSSRNTNKHTDAGMELLSKSVEKVGAIESISVTEEGTIISGHARKETFDKLGMKPIEVTIQPNQYPVIVRKDIKDNTKEYFEAQILANTTSKKNIDIDTELIEEIAVEYDLDIEELGVEIEQDEETYLEAQEDDFDTTPPTEPKTVLGDLYEIGEHRLLCGDSTDSDQVAKLMNGNKSEISFTSPPYNTKENAKLSPHQNNGTKYNSYSDDLEDEEYLKLLTDFTNNSLLFSDYSFVNIQSLSGNKTALIDFLYNMKSVYADTLIWNKQNSQPAMAENVLNSQFEYIHVFSNKANRAIGTKKFRGTLSNVLEISKQTKNKVKEHNATFPIDLAEHFVLNFSEKSVLDLFLGSGTTMVAAHQLKRKCYGIELDPKYCDVIVKRMITLDPTLKIKLNGIDVTKEWANG